MGCEIAASFPKPAEAEAGAEQLPGFWDWPQNTHTHSPATAPLALMPKFFKDMEKGWGIQSHEELEVPP